MLSTKEYKRFVWIYVLLVCLLKPREKNRTSKKSKIFPKPQQNYIIFVIRRFVGNIPFVVCRLLRHTLYGGISLKRCLSYWRVGFVVILPIGDIGMLYGRYRFPGVHRHPVLHPLRVTASLSCSYRTPRMFSLLWCDIIILFYIVKPLVVLSLVGRNTNRNTYMFHNRLYQKEIWGRVVYPNYII